MTDYFPSKQIPLRSLNLSLDDVAKIFERLLPFVKEQGSIEISRLQRPPDNTEDQFNSWKKGAHEQAFRITVTVVGVDGSELYGDKIEMFKSANLPQRISSVFMTNVTAYSTFSGRNPVASFRLNLDFSKPPLLDGTNFVSSPTPNVSSLSVSGDRESWVASVTDAVMGAIQYRKTQRAWIHRAFVYDIGLLVFALPFSLYTCWQLSTFVNAQLGSVNAFVSAAAYVYIFLAVIWVYRILFGYTKWAFPTVELSNNDDKTKLHRAFWYAIVMSLLGRVIWELL